eukprot:CAMPEP_0183355018 /NCGR_PEP_ID=MMETSP0164_2-20130417/38886_1 /TAXON_ID=221442 /ORGANISM="Coccolithus pelagicus ssp braarudi, Strain PLY182g" /LENGTH=137 /DNA_ID=CAMNT_0025528019 /DNA_START=81 /DNA_END=494 /DNA_ORIENTATION=-
MAERMAHGQCVSFTERLRMCALLAPTASTHRATSLSHMHAQAASSCHRQSTPVADRRARMLSAALTGSSPDPDNDAKHRAILAGLARDQKGTAWTSSLVQKGTCVHELAADPGAKKSMTRISANLLRSRLQVCTATL